jgi:phosphopantetheinyl transferase
MPLLFNLENKHGTIAVWSMTESVDELLKIISLNRSDQETFDRLSNVSRKKEFLAVRILLFRLTGKYPEICHDSHGRPSLENNDKYVSISHSRSLAVVYLSECGTGIDTEETTRNVTSVARRFLSPEELSWSSGTADPGNSAILCWSIKESVFKMMGMADVDFRTQIIIDPVIPGNRGETTVTFRYGDGQESITVKYLFEGNNVITWCERK